LRENVPLKLLTRSVFRIHVGNKAEDTQGCILVGENRVKGMVVNSRIWLHRLMKKMNEAQLKEESIWITII
jgi:hypothetical protein